MAIELKGETTEKQLAELVLLTGVSAEDLVADLIGDAWARWQPRAPTQDEIEGDLRATRELQDVWRANESVDPRSAREILDDLRGKHGL